MKRLAILLGLLIAVSVGYAQEVQATSSVPYAIRDMDSIVDSLENQGAIELQYKEAVSTVLDLHDWFDREFLRFTRDHHDQSLNTRVVPLGVFRAKRYYLRQDTAEWNMGAEYHLPLNTMNGSFTVFSHRFGTTQAFAKLFLGFGMGPIQGLDPSGIEVSSNFGINGELVFNRESNWFNPLLGLSYVWVNPDDGSDGQGNYLYGGNRLFITSNRTLSFDLRAGSAFWRGLDQNTPPGWFFSGGLTLHSDVDITRVSSPLLAPIEVGVFGNISLKTISGKVMFPLRLRKGVSLAPFASYGREIGSEPYSAVYGVGGELRMFGDLIAPSLNPYVGFQQFWLAESLGAGSGFSVYFGSRKYIWADVLALDGNIGVAFWQEDTQEDRDLKDWIGRIGVTFAFGKIRDKYDVRGTVMTKSVGWDKSKIDPKNYERLSERDVYVYDGEVRLYGLVECDSTVKCPPCDTVEGVRVGDLTDLKFFKIDMDFGLALDPVNPKAGLLDDEESIDEEVFIAVLFNRNHTLVNSLTDKNTFFHFIDLDNCQYFGYRWNENSARQPENREFAALGTTNDSIKQPYLGSYDEFVQPMTWLDQTMLMGYIRGYDVEQELLRMVNEPSDPDDSLSPQRIRFDDISNYRLGYVKYKRSTLNKLKNYLSYSNLGVTVLVTADPNRGKSTDSASETDSKPDAYFSNPVKMEDILADDPVFDGFPECVSELTDEHKLILEQEIIPRLWSNKHLSVTLTGYTDKTPMSPDCKVIYPSDDGQKKLATARAHAVADYLMQNGIKGDRIKVIGFGIKPPGRVNAPRDRCVELVYSD